MFTLNQLSHESSRFILCRVCHVWAARWRVSAKTLKCGDIRAGEQRYGTSVLGAKHGSINRLINVDDPSHNGNPYNNNGYLTSHSSFDDHPPTWETKPCELTVQLRSTLEGPMPLEKLSLWHQDKAKDWQRMAEICRDIQWRLSDLLTTG